jgi:tyrosine-protein phosphatase YwqE
MEFLRRIFRSEQQMDPIDLGLLKTDVHSHLIPGIDDGAKIMEDTLDMLRKFEEMGYQKVITTPHIMSDFYRNTTSIINDGLEQVREAISNTDLTIKIEAAAEYYLDFHFRELIDNGDLLTFGDKHILFELSFTQEQSGIHEVVFDLVSEGYKPILAHVERYPFYNSEWDKIEAYRERGCLLQLNINSLSGQYGPHVKRMAEQLIDRGWIDLVGSDCHHMRHLDSMDMLRRNSYVHKIIQQEGLLNQRL